MPDETSHYLERPETDSRTHIALMLVLRAMFVLALGAVGWGLASDSRLGESVGISRHKDLIIIGFVGMSILVIGLDVFIPRKSLTAISGLFFGLVVGMVIAYGLSLIIGLLVEVNFPGDELTDWGQSLVGAIKLALGVICCYLAVSFILQTKDDVRFVIPYVQFAKETKGFRPLILDTSVIVDGRIADIADTLILESDLVVPRFVLQELQAVADSGDKLKRTRGRRGLDMLNKLQSSEKVNIRILDVDLTASGSEAGVDDMLVDLAMQLRGKIVTNDFNLNKISTFRGVPVININDLANALKPVVLPGESLVIKVIKPGEEAGQGIGYLDDGTMVVAEGARNRMGETVDLTVTSVLQTSAGRMVFGRVEGAPTAARRRPRNEQEPNG